MLLGLLSLLVGQILGNSVVPIGTKISIPFTGAIEFAFLRFLVGTLILFVVLFFSQKRKLKRSEYKDFALLGFLLGINIVLFSVGISLTTVIMSTLIYSLAPILVGIGGWIYLGETLDKNKLVGLFVSFIGLLFLISQSVSGLQKNAYGEPLGNILICIGMICYSFYVIYSRKMLHNKEHLPLQTTFLTFAFVSLFIFIILIIGIFFGSIDVKPLPTVGIWGILIVGVGSVFQYLFLQIGVKRIDAFTSSLFQYPGPFIAASITIPFLHEKVTLQLLFGGLLIFAGLFIATTYKYLKKR